MVKEACLRQGMLPLMMEHLPTNSDDAIKTSLKMVDEADLYLGIFAYRYGYIPEGHKLSITEMEYNQAVKRKIPRLIFIMLSKGQEYTVQGQDDYEERYRQRVLHNLNRRAQQLRMTLIPTGPVAQPAWKYH